MVAEIINIPLFSYFGNKDNEMGDIIKNLPNMNHIDTIIEPYCGSFALTRYLLTMYPNKKYICNDNDELLIKTYKVTYGLPQQCSAAVRNEKALCTSRNQKAQKK